MNISFNGGYIGPEALCYQGREIIKQLDSLGHKIKIDSQPVSGYWERFFKPLPGPEDVYILNGHVPYLKEIAKEHKKIISICVFEARLPDEWVEALNLPEVKQVWTVSEFGKQLIVESGCKKPVKIIYLGLDKSFFKTKANFFGNDKSFKFLNISAPHGLGKNDRKGLDLLIKAFKKAFGDNPNTTLVLKINTIYANDYNRRLNKVFNVYEYIRSLIPEGHTPNNILVITDYYDTPTLNLLYNSVDVGVFPARAECFGLVQAEMMKIGKPVLYTNYSAPTEFGDPNLAIPIREGQWPLDYNEHPYYDQPFPEVDIDILTGMMRGLYENYHERYVQGAEKHAEYIKKSSLFTWEAVGKRMDIFLKEL